jgi:DNA-directed RNA polymerase specialized sigma24 family protein
MAGISWTPARVVGGDIVDQETDIEEEVIARLQSEALGRGLAALEPTQRRVLVWSFGLNGVGELGIRAIARRLHCSKSQVARLRGEALKEMRKLIEGEISVDEQLAPHPELNGTRRH